MLTGAIPGEDAKNVVSANVQMSMQLVHDAALSGATFASPATSGSLDLPATLSEMLIGAGRRLLSSRAAQHFAGLGLVGRLRWRLRLQQPHGTSSQPVAIPNGLGLTRRRRLQQQGGPQPASQLSYSSFAVNTHASQSELSLSSDLVAISLADADGSPRTVSLRDCAEPIVILIPLANVSASTTCNRSYTGYANDSSSCTNGCTVDDDCNGHGTCTGGQARAAQPTYMNASAEVACEPPNVGC